MASVDSELQSAFDVLYGQSPDAIAVATGSVVVYANPACRKLYGYQDAHECVGQPFLDMIAPKAHDMIIEMARRRSAGEPVPGAYLTTSVRKDGSEFANELRSTVFMYGGGLYITVAQREVPERDIKPEPGSTPPYSDAFYRAVFNLNTAIKLLIDPNSGEIVDANQPAVEFYGWPIETLRGMCITEINQLSVDEVREEMQNARSGRRQYFCFRHRVASGEIRHVEVHSGPLELDGRQLLLSIIHDVTERDALAAQLRASQQLEAVGRLAGGISHEFNNLLTVVLNGSSMVLRKMPRDSPLRHYLEDMSYASQRAADLTRDLLAFSRRQVMAPQSLDLNRVVQRMSGMLQRSLGSSCQIVSELAAELPATRSDPRQLEHVLMNLVLNASDAMSRGGRITVTTRALCIGELDAWARPRGRWVSLCVCDDGDGMDEDTRSRLFEPFFTTKTESRGTGLGMATVYGIIKQSGGHIRVESALGKGTTVEVLLPIAAHAPTAAPPDPPPKTPVDSPVILLVDDVDRVRRSLATSLEILGFRVIQANSSAEATALWHEHEEEVDALITDIVMPGTSGIELANTLLAARSTLPVIVISGDLRGHDLSVLPAGTRTLQKPITADMLAGELSELLSRGGEPTPIH